MSPAENTSARPSPLAAALRVQTPTLIYGVHDTREVLEAINTAAGASLPQVDGRGEVSGASFAQALAAADVASPLVVLLGSEMSDAVRAALMGLEDAAQAPKLVAVSPVGAPSEEMAALFPLQLAASTLGERPA